MHMKIGFYFNFKKYIEINYLCKMLIYKYKYALIASFIKYFILFECFIT